MSGVRDALTTASPPADVYDDCPPTRTHDWARDAPHMGDEAIAAASTLRQLKVAGDEVASPSKGRDLAPDLASTYADVKVDDAAQERNRFDDGVEASRFAHANKSPRIARMAAQDIGGGLGL